ncbi:MAG: hypothetical protein NVSMB70_17980 [Chamaesiphon sp.]
MKDTTLVKSPTPQQTEQITKVISAGDLSTLTAIERVHYYFQVCESLELNPLTKPFDYIKMKEGDGADAVEKLSLYVNQSGAAQLRTLHKISLAIASREILDDCCIVTVRATTPDGRADEATGIVSLENRYGKLKGMARANAIMKAEGKAKRRATLSICGLGWVADEDSGQSLPAAIYDPPMDVVDQPALVPVDEPWRDWKGAEDAISWAKTQLPEMELETLRELFARTEPDESGKKAIAWAKKIQNFNNF